MATEPEPILRGLKVVEIGQYVAAPLAATIFADLGAEVVKVERPGGDPLRAEPARFAAWNRGKRSLEMDLRSPDGRRAALDLIDGADLLVENLRPGALERLGLAPEVLQRERSRLVTCSISAWGSTGPSRDDPGWEALVHARAGAQQGLFTGDDPIWLPFPLASVAAALLAVLGAGAALVKRASTGYGQHVETSLLDGLLFLNAAPIFHREGHRPLIVRQTKSPILRVFDTADDRAVMVNLSGTERWRELCRLLDMDDGGLDYSTPEGLSKLSNREWNRTVLQEVINSFASKTADEWEAALLEQPAAVARCNTLAEWLGHEQARVDELVRETEDPVLGRVPLMGPAVRIGLGSGGSRPGRRHGAEHGALGGHRIIDLSNFWAGPLAARLLAELGADVVKVEPPGGEGAFQLMPVLPNIYVDGNRSKRGVVLDLKTEEDRARLLDLVAVSDVVVENAMAGAWERLGLDEARMREVNPSLVYARAKGFGVAGPLAARPSFDYVIQAATGMEMTQGGGTRPVPVNFTANDYGTGLLLAAGIVLALLGRGMGAAVTTVEASLALTATLYQSEDVAALAVDGVVPDQVGGGLGGPSVGCQLYRAKDGWVTVCCVTDAQRAALGPALGTGTGTGTTASLKVEDLAEAVGALTAEEVLSSLREVGVPAALSVHPSAVPDDPQVVARELLRRYRHPAAGRFVQVGIPLSLSVDRPAVKGPAPTPAPVRRRVKQVAPATKTGVVATPAKGSLVKIDSGLGTELPKVADRVHTAEAAGLDCLWAAETTNDPFLSLILAAEHSTSVSLGSGVAIAFARNPMSLAYTTNQLQEYSGGRVVLGMGSQVRRHIEKRFSSTWSHPAARMREYVLALRAIWASWNEGAGLEFEGDFYTHTLMTPVFAPRPHSFGPPRVFLAAVGPLMNEVAGEVADGVITHGICSARYLREVIVPALDRGLAKSGRAREAFEVTCPGFISVVEDESTMAKARDAMRRHVGYYASTPAYRPVLDLHGWGDLQTELYACSKTGRWDEMARLVDDSVLDTLTIVCTPDRLAGEVATRYGGLVDRISVSWWGKDWWPDVEKALRAL